GGEPIERRLESGPAFARRRLLPVEPPDLELSLLAVELRVETPDELLAVEEREDVVAEATLRGGHEGLEAVVEAEEPESALAVTDHRVERAQEAHARGRPWRAREALLPVGNGEGL